MKKSITILVYIFIAIFLGSCASFNYENQTENRTITIKNVKGVNYRITSKKSDVQIGMATSYETEIELEGLAREHLTLVLSHPNYESQEISIKRIPRVKALLKDIGLGIFTFGIPLLIDCFNEDFYKVSSKSKEISVDFKFKQSYMSGQFENIKHSKNPQNYADWLERYPYSDLYGVVLDKKDSLELEIALSTRKEYEIDDYIKNRRDSRFLSMAIGIKREMVEARTSFNIAKEENSVVGFEDFLKRYPKSLHNDKAKELLEIATKRDIRLYFEKTKGINTIEAYTQFLKKHPESLHDKEAHVLMNEAAERIALNSSGVKEILDYIKVYMIPNSTYYSAVEFKQKKEKISLALDLQIINSSLSNDPKQIYEDYSKLWIAYIEVIFLRYESYLNHLEKSYSYKTKICDHLFSMLKSINSSDKQADFKKKLTVDFPYLNYPNKNTDIFNTILMNLSTGGGKLNLFNSNFLKYYFDKENKLNGRDQFNYRGSDLQVLQNITHEELFFANGKLSGVNSAFNQSNLDFVLKINSSEKELNYFQNGKLILKTVLFNDGNEYSYEFNNGVNLTLQSLDEEIKMGLTYQKNKDYESAIKVFESAFVNRFPQHLPQNILLNKQLSLARTQYGNYLAKQEAARLAEERRQEAARLAKERRQEAARLAEERRKEAARLAEERRQEAARLAEEKKFQSSKSAGQKKDLFVEALDAAIKKNSNNSNHQNSATNNFPYVNVSDEEDVMRFLRSGYKWSCPDVGRYVVSFTYDYHYSYNTFGLIFWTLNRSDPTNVFINVNVSPGFRSCRLFGEDPVTGKNVRINLFSDGHCESEGFYFNISR